MRQTDREEQAGRVRKADKVQFLKNFIYFYRETFPQHISTSERKYPFDIECTDRETGFSPQYLIKYHHFCEGETGFKYYIQNIDIAILLL